MRTVSIDLLHEKFTYDPSTGLLHDKGTGNAVGNNSKGYLKVSVNSVNLAVHRVAWAMHYGKWPSMEIDHRDHNRANNRIDNLREATHSQNNANTKPQGALKPKGVSWAARLSKFRAQIKRNTQYMHIGYFETEDEAAHAYNKAAIKLHGEFACLNPIGVDK